MDSKFAYLLGASADAAIYSRAKKQEYCIEYEQKNQAWLRFAIIPKIRDFFKKDLKIRKRKSGLYRIRLYSKSAYDLFREWRENLGLISKESEDFQIAYVRGFFDADGSAPIEKYGVRRIEFYQKDRKPLIVIANILEKIGIRVGKITNSRNIGQLIIRGKTGLMIFKDRIGSEHPNKIRAISHIK